jgi:hypothetical protein
MANLFKSTLIEKKDFLLSISIEEQNQLKARKFHQNERIILCQLCGAIFL